MGFNVAQVVEGLFSLIVIGTFLLFVGAKIKKTSFVDYFNDLMDKLFGKSDDIKFGGNGGANKFKASGLFAGLKAPPVPMSKSKRTIK